MKAVIPGAVILVLIALAEPPRVPAPRHDRGAGPRNIARGCLVYARPGTFWAPGAPGDPQAGLQRLTDGIFAGRAPLGSRQTILLAPYTADLPQLPLAALPEELRQSMPRVRGTLEVDLGGIYSLSSLALEADAAGDYQVERSLEGRFWHSLWTAPAAFGESGFVVRRSGPLKSPVEARYVRVGGGASYGEIPRPESGPFEARPALFALTEFQIFSSQGRPRLDTILPGMDSDGSPERPPGRRPS